MWACPRCGAKFVSKNASHSCVKQTLTEFFATSRHGGVKHAKALIAAVRAFGPVTLHPVKTRVALMVDVRFAAINRIGDDSIRGHVWLREGRESVRFVKIEKLGARDWLYHFVISDEQANRSRAAQVLASGLRKR
jgi:hypothetical protein